MFLFCDYFKVEHTFKMTYLLRISFDNLKIKKKTFQNTARKKWCVLMTYFLNCFFLKKYIFLNYFENRILLIFTNLTIIVILFKTFPKTILQLNTVWYITVWLQSAVKIVKRSFQCYLFSCTLFCCINGLQYYVFVLKTENNAD